MHQISPLLNALVNNDSGFSNAHLPFEEKIRQYLLIHPEFMNTRIHVFVSWVLNNKRLVAFGITERYGFVRVKERNILCEFFYDFQYVNIDEIEDYSPEVRIFKEAYKELELVPYVFTSSTAFHQGVLNAKSFNNLINLIRRKSRLKCNKGLFEHHNHSGKLFNI